MAPGFDVVGAVEAFQVGGLQMLYAFPLALFEGVTAVSLDVSLPRNALVDAFRVVVQAQRVDQTRVQEVAQLRSYASDDGNELVIDFGTPRTVNGITLPSGAEIVAVFGWLGSQFSTIPAFGGNGSESAVFAELRSERLRVLMSRALAADELDDVSLRLPEPPSGLEIRIDDGAPVYVHPDPVQPRAAVPAPDPSGWDKESRRVVDLTAALAALTGDPLAGDEAVAFRLTLTTKVPCKLALTEQTRTLRRVRRVAFGAETSVQLDFDAEGALDLPLALPAHAGGAARLVGEVRWVAAADLAPERVIPPLGPDAALAADGATVLADLLVTTDRAACARLPAGTGLAELSALRLPLAAIGDGAEARLVLWAPGAPGGLPSAPLPQGTSKPVTLPAAAPESWLTFAFAKPVPLDPAALPWVALVATRGTLGWVLARAGSAALADQQLVRRGPPNGPWQALPAPLQSAAGVIDARARLRLVGLAPKAAPLAPLTLALAGQAATDLNPTPKGAPASLRLEPPVAAEQPVLRLVSRVAGSVVLRDVDVVSNL